MSDEIAIRPGRAEDVPRIHDSILALARHVGGEGYVTSSRDDLLRHGFGQTPQFSTEIAEVGGTFAGMCLHFPIFSTWMGGPGVFVQDLYVEPSMRGRRIGEALLRHVARASRAKGGIYLRLSVDTDNLSAVGFYDRLGIRHSDYEQIHKITGADFVAFCEAEGARPQRESR